MTREEAVNIARESMSDARVIIEEQLGNGASYCTEYQCIVASIASALVQCRTSEAKPKAK